MHVNLFEKGVNEEKYAYEPTEIRFMQKVDKTARYSLVEVKIFS